MTNIDYKKIELLVLDVDGVLTDGSIVLSSSGEESKAFNAKDGAGIKYWQRAGGKTAIITGRKSAAVDRRAEELGIEIVHQKCLDKLPVFEAILDALELSPEQTAVVGDDLPDLPMLRACGFSAAPADAVEEVRQQVDTVCTAPGGRGCVREVVELLLRGAGKWEAIMARYRPAGQDG